MEATYGEVCGVEPVLFVLVGAVQVGLAQPQDPVRARPRRRHGSLRRHVVEPRCSSSSSSSGGRLMLLA